MARQGQTPSRAARQYDRRLPRQGIVAGNSVKLLANGGQAYPAMLEAIYCAHCRVDMCMYIFRADRIGMRFAEALADRARRGLWVRVAYDAVGSGDVGMKHFDLMRQAGVEVHCVNPLLPRVLSDIGLAFARDHRKILAVDDEIGFIGGINIGDEYDGDARDNNHLRDYAVRMHGPAGQYLRQLVEQTYRNLWGLNPTVDRRCPSAGDTTVWFQSPRPLDPRRIIVNTYRALAGNAQRYAWIAQGYFLPNYRVVTSLIRAARRGVDVRLLLPSKTDIPIIQTAGRLWYRHLLRHGVRVFELTGAILHAKAAVADDSVAVMGSANLDARGFYLNREVLATIHDATFATSLRKEFELDFARSREVLLGDLQRATWGQRIKQKLAFAISPFL